MRESGASDSRRAFRALRRELIHGGVAPSMVTRTLAELQDHFEDLQAEAVESGSTGAEASAEAMDRLGSTRDLAQEILRYPEIQSWAFRWPWVPAVLRQFVILTSVVSVPVLVVVSRGPVIVRWCVSTGLAMLVTGGIFLLLRQVLMGALPR